MTSTQPILAEEVIERRADAERRRHLLFLGIAIFVFAMAWALEVRPDERVQFRLLRGWPLPQSCYSRSLLGLPCPGCGLTRSFVYLIRGQWQQAWNEHRLGWLLAGLVAFQLPYRAWALWRGGRRAFSARFANCLAGVIAALLFANWAIQIAAARL